MGACCSGHCCRAGRTTVVSALESHAKYVRDIHSMQHMDGDDSVKSSVELALEGLELDLDPDDIHSLNHAAKELQAKFRWKKLNRVHRAATRFKRLKAEDDGDGDLDALT